MGWTSYIFVPLFILFCRSALIYIQDPSDALQRVESRLENLSKKSVGKGQKVSENVDIDASAAVVIAAVACGGPERMEELSVMLKSAVIFSSNKYPLKFLIFTDKLAQELNEMLKKWKIHHKNITWDIRYPQYPELLEVKYFIFRVYKKSYIGFFPSNLL
jgi:hypothetical protein